MRRFKLWALLLSISVLTVAAVGNSAAYTSGNVTLKDFDTSTDVLLGYPNDLPPLGWYQRNADTKYFPAVVSPHVAPSPCRAYSVVWNIILARVPSDLDRRSALTAILQNMARHDCLANITRDETTSPAPIIDIQPTP